MGLPVGGGDKVMERARARRTPTAALVRLPRTGPRPPTAPDALVRETLVSPAVAARDRRYRRALAVADALSALVALLLCVNVLGHDRLSPLILLGLPAVILAGKLTGLYDRDPQLICKDTMNEAPALFHLATLYALVVWMLGDAVGQGPLTPLQVAVLWGSLFLFSLLFRRAARAVAAQSVQVERLLLIGDPATYDRLAHKLDAGAMHARLVGRLPLAHIDADAEALRAIVADLDVHRVVIVPSQTDPQLTLDLLRAVKTVGVRVSLVPHVLDVVGNAVCFDDLGGMTLLGVRDFGLSRSSHAIKRAFDLTGAVLGLAAAAPLMLAIAVAIRVNSRGPVLFRQERVGKDGRRFRIYKFRTMVADAEARRADLLARNQTEGLFKLADDPRITRVGRLLRRTSLDELPQLLNVARGEMSLVGPRPLILAEDEAITGYDRRRLTLMPGMTGHWQIMGSAKVPLHEMVKIDYLYVTTWTLFQDVKILVRTVPYMLARRGL
jgi:exopolysaccharide biosynthesis polyprenyl glycosylphosphotransferase